MTGRSRIAVMCRERPELDSDSMGVRIGFIIFILVLSWVFFADLTEHRLDSHDIEMFRDHTAIGGDITLMFSSAREQRSGRPVSELVKWLFYLVNGNDVVAFHLLSIGMHTLASLLLPALFRQWGASPLLSRSAAVLFHTQTAHYEPVHHISALDYPLALLFGIAAIATFQRYLAEQRNRRLLLFSLTLPFGMLCHLGIGFVWFVCVYLGRHSGLPWRRLLTAVFPTALAGATLVPLLMLLTSKQTNAWDTLEAHGSGSVLGLAGGAIEIGLWLLSRLVTTAHWLAIPAFRMQTWEPYFGAGVLILLVVLARRDSPARVGVIWSLAMLIPFALVSEQAILPYLPAGPSRYVYFSSAGASLVLAWASHQACHRLGRWRGPAFTIVMSGLLVSGYAATDRLEALSLFTSSRSYHIRGELGDGIQQLRRAMDRAPEAIDLEDAYRRLSLLSMAQGVDATTVIDAGLQRLGPSPTPASYRVAAMAVLSDAWLAENEIPSAQVPAYSQAFHHLGVGHARIGDLPRAVIALRTSLRLQPDRDHTRGRLATALANLATSLAGEGRYQAAAEACEEAIILEPSRPEHHVNLGVIALVAEDRLRALTAFREALELGSVDPHVYWTLARLYQDAGERTEATATYLSLLRDGADGLDAEAHVQLGLALDELGEHVASEAAYRRALQLDPRQTTAQVNLGWILFRQGRVKTAIGFYEDVLALGPHSVARFNLGLAYLVDGDVIRARATYALGVRLHGAIEARRIGAVADLEKIGRLPEHAVVAQTILNELWPETTSNRP